MSDLKYNTMRFGTDEFNPYIKQALLVSNSPVNLSNFNRLDQITVQGNEPDGSKRRFMFKMDNKVYKFSGQNLVEYTGDVDSDNVLSSGNTTAQLEAVSNNSQLVGKNIYPIIALYAETENLPTAKISFKASLVQEVLDYTDEKTACHFYDDYVDPSGGRVEGTILGFDWDIDTNGDASGGIKVKLLQNGVWSSYLTLTEALGQTATGITPKFYYHVDAVDGNNSVKIKQLDVRWSPDANSKVYGDVAYIYSNTKYNVRNLSHAVLVVRHEDLDSGSIDADVSFQYTRDRVTNLLLDGNLSVLKKTFTLPQDFFPKNLKVYINGVETTDFEFDTANRTITFPENLHRALFNTVSVDYVCNHEEEIWLPMVRDKVQPTANGLYTTRFALPNPDFDTKNLTTSAIRIKLNRGYGSKSSTKTSSGGEQRVKFAHEPDKIVCDADNGWYFDYDTNELVFNEPAGTTVNISYDWHGQTPVVHGWSVVWSA